MKKRRKQFGFSLTEMLIATGIMAIGLVMVATIFPVGVKLTTLTTERTVGLVVADEAFAKIKLYGLRDFQNWPVVDPNVACSDYQYITDNPGPDATPDTGDETIESYGADGTYDTADDIYFTQYPSTDVPAGQDRNYHWSALCRRESQNGKGVQATVFVTRKFGAGAGFYGYDETLTPVMSDPFNDWPMPVKVKVNREDSKTLTIDITDVWGNTALRFFDDGYTIVDDLTGNVYRILEMKDVYPLGSPDGVLDIVIQGDWFGDLASSPGYPVPTQIWVVPPAVGSDRYPCVGVYQRIIRFDDIQ